MNLYFQFLTQNQSVKSVDLIRLPALLNPEKPVAGQVKISTGGQLLTSKFLSIETLSGDLAKTRFNELEVTYDIRELKVGALAAQVKSLNGVFYPSPTCEQWFPSKDFPRSVDHRNGRRQMNATAKERSLTSYSVAAKPSAFEVALEMKSSESEAKILDSCAEWFSTSYKTFEELGAFGCCDIGGSEMFVRLESHVLMLDNIRVMKKISPAVYSELGEKFDDLHSILFGMRRVCSQLAAALGNDAKLICG